MRWLVVLLLATWPSLALAEPDPATRRDEARLLNQVIPQELLTERLPSWTGTAWRPSGDAKRLQAPVLVLNLWATYCQPCVSEFPLLSEISHRVEAEYTVKDTKEVQFLFISETGNPEQMIPFVTQNKARLPKSALYLDDNENISAVLVRALLGRKLLLPTTLIVDERRVIRYAIIGSVVDRRAELVNAIEDVVRAVRVQTAK